MCFSIDLIPNQRPELHSRLKLHSKQPFLVVRSFKQLNMKFRCLKIYRVDSRTPPKKRSIILIEMTKKG